MRTVLTILLIAVIGGICALEAVFIRQGRRMPKRSCVRLSVAYPIVGVVFGAMFLYLMNMAVHEQDSNPWVAMGFLVFVLMGISLILAWINYRIWYDSSGFIIRNVLGVRRDYTYSDITGLREYPKEARLYFGKRHITLDTTDAPQKMFLERVKLHYAAIHDGQSVPYVPPRIDPFRGHIINPESWVIYFAAIFVFVIGICVYVYIAFRPVSSDALAYRDVVFDYYELRGDKLLLYPEGEEKRYQIPNYQNELTDVHAFFDAFDAGETLHIGYRKYTTTTWGKGQSFHYWHICSMTGADGTVYLPFDKGLAAQRAERRIQLWFNGGLGAVILLLCVLTLIVGRYPEKFPPKLVRFLFRDTLRT